MTYVVHVLITLEIYAILSLSLNLITGYAGMFSLAHAAFYGIGAYVNTLLVMRLGFGMVPALISSIALAMLSSLPISIPSSRLKGDYFLLASLGFQIIVYHILLNWVSLTKGPYGITGIPRPQLGGIRFEDLPSFLIISSFLAAVCVLLLVLTAHLPFGRALKAIREDELAAAAVGKNVVRFKVTALAIAAGFAAVAGVIFSGYMRFLDPSSFTVMDSVFIISILIIGGAGNFFGPLLGTLIMVSLPEVLRLLNIPGSVAPNLRQIIYGLLIILILRLRPQGLAGNFRFE
jgi:branched-chain amino acid transport system permease protein